jgi:hypothetical protein
VPIAYDRAMPTTDQILDSIENRLRDLNAEIDTLTAAREALERTNGQPEKPAEPDEPARPPEPPAASSGTDGRSRQAKATRSRRRPRRARAKRSFDVVPAGKLELLLSGGEGLTTSALADRANGDRDQVLMLLRELEAAGRVRRTGQRRGTRWHVITDEERIEQRAAELAAMSRRRRQG